MKKSLIFVLLSCGLAFAQGVRFGDGQPTLKAQTVGGKPNVLASLPNATISVCGVPANAVPCTNKVTTYTDSTLAVACSTSTQLVLAGTNTCVSTTDSLGNWGLWLPSGQYSYTVTVGGTSTGPFNFSLATGNGGTNGVNIAHQSDSSYTFLTTDSGKSVVRGNAAAMNDLLPAANTLGQAWTSCVINVSSTANVTVTAASNTINGGSGSQGFIVPAGRSACFFVDQDPNSPNYWAQNGTGFTGSFNCGSGCTFTGNVNVSGDLNVGGNIAQTGTGAWQFSGKQQAATTVTVPVTSDFSTFVGSDQLFKCQLLSGAWCSNPVAAMLTAVFTQTGTNFLDVPGMGWPIVANQKMKIDCDFVYQESASSNQPKIQFTGPASPTAISFSTTIFNSTISISMLASHTAAFSTPLDNAGAGTGTTDLPFHITIGIQNGSNPGTVQLQAASHGAGTTTFQQGGVCTRTVTF